MTSLELLAIINNCRIASGESEVEYSHFLKRVEDEIESNENFSLDRAANGRDRKVYVLGLDDCMLVGMRESNVNAYHLTAWKLAYPDAILPC